MMDEHGMAAIPLQADELERLDRERFVGLFGGVFEHAPWIAAQAFELGPFRSLEALHGAMVEVLYETPRERQLALICAHPDLAGRAAMRGQLTAASSVEQTSAGLDQCTPAEFARFQELNRQYREKFGFPFILAVKGRTRAEILAAFECRLGQSPKAEFEEALRQIARIARLRLDDLVRA